MVHRMHFHQKKEKKKKNIFKAFAPSFFYKIFTIVNNFGVFLFANFLEYEAIFQNLSTLKDFAHLIGGQLLKERICSYEQLFPWRVDSR